MMPPMRKIWSLVFVLVVAGLLATSACAPADEKPSAGS
jgi:hypothetical protein